MNKVRAGIVSALLSFLFLSQTAMPADIYVRAGADGDGAKGSPYGRLWKALDKAVRGDVIHVAGGTYNGKGGSGAFLVKVPDLTLAGGYNEDFSVRDPFEHPAVLERAEDYRGDATGLPDGIISGAERADHSGLTVDGFVLDSRSRNTYTATGKINPKKSWNGKLFGANSANSKIRNCILLNPYGDGIYCAWQGKENEISNCFIVNTFHTAISTRSAQEESVIRIKDCTVIFTWFQPGKGGGIGVFVGRQGKTVLENNVFAFAQTEGDAGYAVSNTFGNDFTEMKNNVFFQCQGGYYKYKDFDGRNLLVWKKEDLEDLNDDPESYMLWEAGGNTNTNPEFKPDKEYFKKFSSTVASKPGKLKMDTLNQWRRSVGLPLQAEAGTGRKNWGMAHPRAQVTKGLVSETVEAGAKTDVKFAEYRSDTGEAKALDYEKVEFDAFSKDQAGITEVSGKPVKFKAALGPKGTTWFLDEAPREDYLCVKLLKPGEGEYTRKYIYGYLLKGSEAAQKWQRYYRRKDRYNKRGGLTIRGTASYCGKKVYTYPVGVIIKKVSRR